MRVIVYLLALLGLVWAADLFLIPFVSSIPPHVFQLASWTWLGWLGWHLLQKLTR